MDQERFPEPLNEQVRLYLLQRGWIDVPGGWQHDHPIFKCKRCIEDRDEGVVTLITPIGGSRGGYRLSTCTECQLKDLACPLISAVVRLRYHWTEQGWQMGLLGRRCVRSEDLATQDAGPLVVNDGHRHFPHDPAHEDVPHVEPLHTSDEDFPRDSESASTTQQLGGQLAVPHPEWFMYDAIEVDDIRANRDPRLDQGEDVESDGATFIVTLPSSRGRDRYHGPQARDAQLDDTPVDHLIEPNFGGNADDHQGPPPFDAQFDDWEEAIDIDPPPPELAQHYNCPLSMGSPIQTIVSEVESNVRPQPFRAPPIAPVRQESVVNGHHTQEERVLPPIAVQERNGSGLLLPQPHRVTPVPLTVTTNGATFHFTESELQNYARTGLRRDNLTPRGHALVFLFQRIIHWACNLPPAAGDHQA